MPEIRTTGPQFQSEIGRRRFVQGLVAAIAAGPLAMTWADATGQLLPIRAAGYRFPRVEPLFDGRVSIEGCSTHYDQVGIGDANTATFSGAQPWDVTEIGLHPFMLAYANDGFRDFTLLPIFPLRVFRHKSIFIRPDRGIKKPEDLRGKIIATPGYSSTSLTWIRGILQDEYGVAPGDMNWVVSRKDSSGGESGKVSKQEQMVPEGITLQSGRAGMDESELLVSGEVDALFHAATPQAYLDGNPNIARLFPNSREVELDYYEKTGIFPIMHAVAVRRTLLEKEPQLAGAIFDAYSKAKTMAYQSMNRLGWAADMLPWYGQELEQTVAAMGPNFYSYGIGGNRKSLDALFRYSHEQGLASRQLKIEELFHPESLAFEETQGGPA